MDKYIEETLKEAKKSFKTDDVPVGAIIVEKGKIIAKAHNTREKKHKITGHAEINAIEKACKKKKTWHLQDCTMYVTLKPCKMCEEAIKQAQIKHIYYFTEAEKVNLRNIEMTKIEDQGISSKLLKKFFKTKRNN